VKRLESVGGMDAGFNETVETCGKIETTNQ